MKKLGIRAVILMAVCGAIAAVFVSTTGSAGATLSPIKVGAIVSETGPNPFVDWSEGAKAFFKRLNAHGGINGHPVDLIYQDDKGDPTQTALLARQMVGEGVVAFVGSLSDDDCGVNRQYYLSENIVSIDIGGEAACFDTPNMDAVNSGPKLDEESQLLYAAQVLHFKRNCFLIFNTAGMNALAAAAATSYTAITGLKVTLEIKNYPLNGDPTPALLKFKQAGCQSVSFNGQESNGIAVVRAAQQQKITNIKFLSGLSMYAPNFLKESGGAGVGLLALLEFIPFSAPQSTQAVSDFKAAGYTLNQTLDTGWAAAYVFDKVASGIKGPITKDSVTAAFKSMKPLDVPIIGTPYEFGKATSHQSNHAAFAAVLTKSGNWAYTGHKLVINYHK
ncbi:MAG: ABC transporter substrate-binding protein [Solirubrobacteraceae bacterium]